MDSPHNPVRERLITSLADRYRIERELGAGGMATVYLAQDRKHDRQVAVKVLRPELAAVIGGERFLAEIRTTANLQHPNLLPLFDSGRADGFLYYVMPYVEGETLRARLERTRQLGVDETTRLVGLLAGALDYAHARGVIHRDLKPENILLQAGQPVIADFGIALAVAHAGGSRVTETGLSLGTPHYMSPEQAAGERNLAPTSDQYALAAVTYEMVAGEPPHTGPTAQVIIARLMSEKPRSLRATRPAIPVTVDRAVARGLAKSPGDRFASCTAFVEALGAAARPRRLIRMVGAAAAVALVAGGAWVLLRARPAAPAGPPGARSIAVLPLVNVGGDSTQEYFADGMTEELTNGLGKVPGLRVAARTSAYVFKGRRDLDVREAGQKLGVATMLQVTVRRAGTRLRLSVQLTDAKDAVELWSQSYDGDVKDAFALQDSITRAVVSRLALTLNGGALAATTVGRTSNPEAHDLYLQGQALVHQGTEPALRRALGYFRAALAKDPEYAQPYVGIAWAYAFLADTYMVPSVAYDSSRIAAAEAIRRGGETGEALVVLAYASYVFDWQVAAAESQLHRAAVLSPNSSDVAALRANWLCLVGRNDAGVAEADRAIQLDRLAPLPAYVREWCLYMGRRYDELAVQHARTASLDEAFLYLDAFQAAADREQRRYDAALTEYARAQRIAITYARMGRSADARKILGRFEAYGQSHYVNPLLLAFIHAGLDEKDLAFADLERAFADRTALMAGINTWPELDPLRSDPRFAVLVRRAGLVPAP